MRFNASCSGRVCSVLNQTLKARGLKTLFLKNILSHLDGSDENEIRDKVIAVLLGNFDMKIYVKKNNLNSKDVKKSLKEMDMIAKSFLSD